MQRAFLKLAFIGLISVSSALASGDNLLSMATDGAISKSTADTLSLNDKEMKSVAGGLTWYNSYTGIGSRYYNSNTRAVYQPVSYSSRIYASTFGSYYWGRSFGR